MNSFFTRLRVPKIVQSFFQESFSCDNSGLTFFYGNDMEFFSPDVHLMPVTNNYWCAGNQNYHNVREVIICSSAMEAIGFLSRFSGTFKCLEHVLFLSFGLLPTQSHFLLVNSLFKGKKIALVNGNDLIGRVADLKIAAGICGHQLTVNLADGNNIVINFRRNEYNFTQESLTLNSFEKKSKFRSHFRTYKPRLTNSFLELLLNQDQASLF